MGSSFLTPQGKGRRNRGRERREGGEEKVASDPTPPPEVLVQGTVGASQRVDQASSDQDFFTQLLEGRRRKRRGKGGRSRPRVRHKEEEEEEEGEAGPGVHQKEDEEFFSPRAGESSDAFADGAGAQDGAEAGAWAGAEAGAGAPPLEPTAKAGHLPSSGPGEFPAEHGLSSGSGLSVQTGGKRRHGGGEGGRRGTSAGRPGLHWMGSHGN